VLNGGVPSLEAALEHLAPDAQGVALDGVMLGRAAYHEPALLGQVDRRVFGADAPDVSPFEAVEAYKPYLAARLAEGVALHAMTRHMLGLMHGRAGARAFRRSLTVEGISKTAGLEVLDRAVEAVREAEARREDRSLLTGDAAA
jgi:tRNA-dihydrouridine synthase A